MDFTIEVYPYELKFKNPAGTSRGVYLFRKVWYVVIRSLKDPLHIGIGECAPLLDLSCDNLPDYEEVLKVFCKQTEQTGFIDTESLRNYPSMLFGLETAMRQYERHQDYHLYDTDFASGMEGIRINGLIWMGDKKKMYDQIVAKLEAGFKCIKLKIGAIDFDSEIDLLRYIRTHFSSAEIELRVDANGAFALTDAMDKLNRLSEFEIHSIEQPIRAGQWDQMADLCSRTPVPIALDEELIGVNDFSDKQALLEVIKPQYIILKPSLHGGMAGTSEWIQEAQSRNIPWWITSALESNIGLNAIAQWTSTFKNPLPQGLGTGMLYTNNIPMNLEIRQDCLWINPDINFDPLTIIQ